MTAKDFKIARLAMGLTQTALAKKLGVSRSNIIRYEKGLTGISFTIQLLLTRIHLDAIPKCDPKKRKTAP